MNIKINHFTNIFMKFKAKCIKEYKNHNLKIPFLKGEFNVSEIYDVQRVNNEYFCSKGYYGRYFQQELFEEHFKPFLINFS